MHQTRMGEANAFERHRASQLGYSTAGLTAFKPENRSEEWDAKLAAKLARGQKVCSGGR
jgi:hypothetical protein